LYISYCFFSYFSFSMIPPPPRFTLFPYTTLFRSQNKFIMRIIYLACLFLCCVSCSKSNDPVSQDPDDDTPDAESKAIVFKHESRSEEHTSELQSRENLVCRLLLEKKKKSKLNYYI